MKIKTEDGKDLNFIDNTNQNDKRIWIDIMRAQKGNRLALQTFALPSETKRLSLRKIRRNKICKSLK